MPAGSSLIIGAKRIPWGRVLFAAQLVYRKGSAASRALTPEERTRLLDLVRKSKGRRANLSERERAVVRDLAGKALAGARHG